MPLNRRGFLGVSAGTAAASVMSVASAFRGEDKNGIAHTLVCPNKKCGAKTEIFIDLNVPLRSGEQCPKCFMPFKYGDVGEKIIAYYKNKNITPPRL